MSETSHTMAITLLLFSLIFPVFAFTLTNPLAGLPQTEDKSQYFDQDKLISAGVYLRAQERHPLVFGTYSTFTLNESQTQFRVRWNKASVLAIEAGWYFYKPNILDSQQYPTWIFPVGLDVQIKGVDYPQDSPPKNMTIITGFEPAYNWTRISIKDLGLEVFITAEAADNDIAQAVLTNGVVNCTVGQTVNYQDINAWSFMSWYYGMITDNNVYGLPVTLSWLLKINVVLTIFTGIIIFRELTRI